MVLFGADGRYLFVWADVEGRMKKNYNMHCMPMVVLLNLGEDALLSAAKDMKACRKIRACLNG